MIDEIFLENAIRIRRKYLKLSNNMDLYQKKAEETSKILDRTLIEVDVINDKAKNGKEEDTQSLLHELVKVLNNVEEEGKLLEKMVEPINIEIEKLALEEQELFRQIKIKHNNLTDDEIIECVKNRLITEELI